MSSMKPVPASPTTGRAPTPIAATSPADILSYVPHALGFTPVESLVLLTTAGRRLGATLRVDLPRTPLADPGTEGAHAFAEAVLSFIRGDVEANGVLLIVYTDECWARPGPHPRSGLVRVLQTVLEGAGLPVRSGWLVSGSSWRDLFCADGTCCPWPGHPLDSVADSALNAEMIFGGSSYDASASAAVLRSSPDLARVGRSESPARREVEEAQAHYAAACAGRWLEPAQFRATSDFWDAVLDQTSFCIADGRAPAVASAEEAPAGGGLSLLADPDVVGFLLASIESRSVRDFLLVSASLGSARALDGVAVERLLLRASTGPFASRRGGENYVLPAVAGQLLHLRTAGGRGGSDLRGEVPVHGADHPYGTGRADYLDGSRRADGTDGTDGTDGLGDPPMVSGFAAVLTGLYGGTPDWRRIDRLTDLLQDLGTFAGATGEARAAVLCMLGWFDYARGRGSRAAVFLEAAEAALPGYRLARLLNELLSRGALPAWAKSRSTAWRVAATESPSRAA